MFRTISRLIRRQPADVSKAPPGIRRARRSTAPATPGNAREYAGRVSVSYRPEHDGLPDPGEVVWTWVPFEDDPRIGKDRPVVIIGTASDGAPGDLAALQLSSKPHTGDPRWLLLGAGAWDPQGRPSSVRLDRMLAVAPAAVRREGSALGRDHFDAVISRVRDRHRPAD
jgi:PemK-like, MazF-like toxin of type II toxin-antitoxin system